MDPEAKDLHPISDDDLREYLALFDVKGRDKDQASGTIYERLETKKELKLLLESWKQSSHREMERGALVHILFDLFPESDKEFLKESVNSLLGATADDSVKGTPSRKSDGDAEPEIVYDTLAGDDADYLRAIDTPRKLYCPRCKVYDCNIHLEPGQIHGKPSIQLQFEAAMEEEKHGRSKPSLPEARSPVDTSDITERSELTPFQKSICRRVFLIYEGNLEKVAVVVNAPKRLVEEFCRNFAVPKRILLQGRKPERLTKQQYHSTNNYKKKWYNDNAEAGIRDPFTPCVHDEPCQEGKCTCIDDNVFCTHACGFGASGRNFFRGCCCKGPCQKGCTCFHAKRECDPSVCSCDTCQDPPGRPTTKQVCQNDGITMRRKFVTFVSRSGIPEAGYGLFCRDAIPKGKFIDEYVGEVGRKQSLRERISPNVNFAQSAHMPPFFKCRLYPTTRLNGVGDYTI